MSAARLSGEEVVVGYLSDPAAGHGRFRLENGGDVEVAAALDSAWLELAADRLPLDRVSLFDAGRGLPVESGKLVVAAGSGTTLLVGFPRVPFEPRPGETAAVGLRLAVGGDVLEARSPIRFERRIPLDP